MHSDSNQRPDRFEKSWELEPMGDQPQAIESLVEGVEAGVSEQILLGVTGSGKTFTIANVIEHTQRPALILAHNKTLAAQLFQEFKALFPNNAVEYFISYYDYYQPEAYVPSTDTFIDKVATINEDIDKMRHSATRALLEREDVIIVSSVSCIYGLGDPEAYLKAMVMVEEGARIGRDELLAALVSVQYSRNDISLERGKFRVRGDVVEIIPSHERDKALRISFFGNKIEKLHWIDALRGTIIERVKRCAIYPGSHHVTDKEQLDDIIERISLDLIERMEWFRMQGMHVEAQRIEQRVLHDLEMMREVGYCQGIENYSRYLDNRQPGEPPSTLLDYFPENYLLIIDESHVTIPQIGGMFRGDRARKETLVEHGFRLPAALDNRPLNFDEFLSRMGQTIYVSATPGRFELERCNYQSIQQIIRPTGLVDPIVEVRPAQHQVDDLLGEIKKTIDNKGRVLITTLTKKMSEDLTNYYKELGIRIRYLHSDIDSIERVEILRDLRIGLYDVLVGINLLREGLDLPEVQLVGILDADKEGFLRSRTSLIQTVGRAARNAQGRVILYADKTTDSITATLNETNRRRELQIKYNQENNIIPQTIIKKIPEQLRKIYNLESSANEDDLELKIERALEGINDRSILTNPKKLEKEIKRITKQIQRASQQLEFEEAAALRDQMNLLKEVALLVSTAAGELNQNVQ
ncbi:MAG: excinuclease ABC subunit UvrB [Betaproteobacteria bacterium]|nr:excinuclease ABC subunit UvrB [Betaproteobacteria bacterium]